MQAYRLLAGSQIAGLQRVEAPARAPAPHEVCVRIRAVSLNFRDLMLARGWYPNASSEPVVPCSDGAGEVIAVGSAVRGFKPGDRVVSVFSPYWLDGEPTPANVVDSLGGAVDGVLAQEVTLPETAWLKMPAHLDFVEAATLPCSGVTAWNAMFAYNRLRPGATVLLLGTGGVSIIALQLAHAAGLRSIITSSSDDKLERARQLGADLTINYRKTPEWQDEVRRLTEGAGADLVLEVGGEGTLSRSVAATRMHGEVVLIGGVTGFGGGDFNPIALMLGSQMMRGVYVGSRHMAEELYRLVEVRGIKPVVDRVFGFAQAQEAYEYLASGQHFGKVAIRVD